jgi:D-glycero-D-manno-heptose 1,7-bisphosphate phosphatase|tara:strand:+ start:173 stop:319 length:147 start_codon:yes stop_codon:yes gene_type:complete
MKKSAVFLDRDGIINHDFSYLHKLEDFKIRKGVVKRLKFISKEIIYYL